MTLRSSSFLPLRVKNRPLAVAVVLVLMAIPAAIFLTGKSPTKPTGQLQSAATPAELSDDSAEELGIGFTAPSSTPASPQGGTNEPAESPYESEEFAGLPPWLPFYPSVKSAAVEDRTLRSDGLAEGLIALEGVNEPDDAIGWMSTQLAAHGVLQVNPGRYASGDGKRHLQISSSSDRPARLLISFASAEEGCGCATCADGLTDH